MHESLLKKPHSRPLQPTGPLSDDWLFADPFTLLGDDVGDPCASVAPDVAGDDAARGRAGAARGGLAALVAAVLAVGVLGVCTHQMSVILSIQEPASECGRFPLQRQKL